MNNRVVLVVLILFLVVLGQAQAKAEPMFIEQDGIKVGYDKGFVLNVKDQFQMKFGAWIQFQHAYIDDENGPNSSTFKLAKGRLRWSGYMYSPQFGYVIQLEVADPNNPKNNGSKETALKDFAIDIKHYENVRVRIGQFKVPFNRQQMAFFGDLQFVDTSLASKAFNANQNNARDIGLMMSGAHNDGKLQYFVGLFNGNGINKEDDNDTSQYLTVGRIVFNPLGEMSISESDVANTENPLFSVGAAYAYDAGNNEGVVNRGSAKTLGLEFSYKYRGKSIQGEYYFRNDDRNADADGAYLQGGIFVVPEKIEVAARYSRFSPDIANSDVEEITLGFNLFFAGHRRKLQIDISNISNDVDHTDDQGIRAQYQIAF
ncbi:hypothetical protein MNBD_NITROSPIRAE01-1984 [hydrothermal vent metagenome]|uniref:Phosphate-selective porin O and P n=1 Tax=hydrothermal vent metagenome TaxID=652676 RepID=A0A3B1DA01_9ZZZZ